MLLVQRKKHPTEGCVCVSVYIYICTCIYMRQNIIKQFRNYLFAATLTLLRVWLQVAMKIKFMLLPTSINILFIRGGKLFSDEDKDDVISPINILFIRGGGFRSLMKIKMMLLPNHHHHHHHHHHLEQRPGLGVLIWLISWLINQLMYTYVIYIYIYHYVKYLWINHNDSLTFLIK